MRRVIGNSKYRQIFQFCCKGRKTAVVGKGVGVKIRFLRWEKRLRIYLCVDGNNPGKSRDKKGGTARGRFLNR